MKVVRPSALLDQLEGATIVSNTVEDDEGLSLYFKDGRVLVIAGQFALSVLRQDTDKLH